MQASKELRDTLQPAYFVVNILLFALTLSIFIYLLLGYMVSRQNAAFEQRPVEMMRNVFVVLSVVTIAATFSIRLFLFSTERLERTLKDLFTGLKNGSLPDLPIAHQNQSLLERVKALPLKEQAVRRMTGKAYTPYILILALHESVAIYGLVLTFMTRDFMQMVPFAVVAILLNLTMAGFINRVINTSLEIVNERRFDFE